MDVENRSRTGPPADAVDPGRIPVQASVADFRDRVPSARSGNALPATDARRPPATQAGTAASYDVVGGSPFPAAAGVVTRVLAAVLDTVAVAVVAAGLDLGAAAARFLWSPRDFSWPQPSTGVTVAVLLGVAVVYLTLGWALAGRTYGARLMGLRVLTSRYEIPGWSRSVLRALACVIWPVGLLWCGISRTRRSLADLLVRTVVVYDVRPYATIRAGAATSSAPPGA